MLTLLTNIRSIKVLFKNKRQHARIFLHRRMEQTNDSDLNPAMLASIAFETIIDKIRNSNLNFQLQLSPFSAQISLKKSLVIEKTGVPRLPRAVNHSVFSNSSLDSEISAFATKNMHLESELGNLRAEYDRAVNDCEEACILGY